jgi:transposase
MSEIDDINGFIKPKHLGAYFGINPSVNQSGKSDSNRNKKCLSVALELDGKPYMLSH